MKWLQFKKLFSFTRKSILRRPIRRARVQLEELECRLAPAVNVLSYEYGITSQDVNKNETQLTPANVQVGSFGKQYTTPVDGQVYAEPLVDTGISIASGPNTVTGAAGTHDVVFVATQHDSLYAIDGSIAGGAVLWKRSFTDITTPGYSGTTPGTNINNPQNATSITTVPYADVGIGDINPEIGITGTPVIDPNSGTLYVVVNSKETIGGSIFYVQRLHAINIADGTDRVAPFTIGDTTNGNTNTTPIYVYGTGDGSVTDPYNGTGKAVDQFNALRENQRSALSLVNNEVYVSWASHGDISPYHGWVVGWDVSNLATNGLVLNGVLNASPNDGLAGIWMGGGQLAFEADGSAFYFETGNGSGGDPVLVHNEQTLTISATAGSYTLSFGGQTTGTIAYNASAATVETDLGALSSIGANNILVSGNAGGPYNITFIGSLGGASQPLITSNPASLTGGNQTATVVDDGGFPVNSNYNDALVKVTSDNSTSPTHQNGNGWGFRVVDFFTPYNVAAMDQADADFGSGGPLILPDSAGIPGHPHLMIAAGKEGKIYLIDRDNMGRFDPTNDNVLNAVPNGSGHNTAPVLIKGALSTGAYYNNQIYWVSGQTGVAESYSISSTGIVSATSQTSASFGYLPGSVVVSANGTTNGIVWVMDRLTNEIHAFDASTFATELWNSNQNVSGADKVGGVVKFAVPTVANGEVFVGTSNSLVVYGLNQPPNAVPSAPVLSTAPLSSTSLNLAWTDPSTSPNTAAGYLIEQSSDNINFVQVATAPDGSNSIAIGGLSPSTTYYFRIRGFNSKGDSAYSNPSGATTTSQFAAVFDFSGGFAGSSGPLTYNGTAAINGTKLELTNGGTKEAGSAFYSSPVDVSQFNTQFTFQLSTGTNTADGFTFTIQGMGATALGPNGGGLGYGGNGGIGKSVAVKFDLHNNNGEGNDSTGLYIDGANPTNIGSIDLTNTGIDLHSGHVFQVTMTYDGTTLAVVILDTVTGRSAIQNYAINIVGTVGSSTAYVGFTGGTGGATATQDILGWTYSAPPLPTVPPNAPTGLGAVPASGTSVTLNWTNNATNQSGFYLDRATDIGFTQNLITQTLPGSPYSFTDVASGLVPGWTYYYRIRAFNVVGSSGNSNPASVPIPVVPPRPTKQLVTKVTTSEIDISWQDNAGQLATSYKMFRAVNHGTFTLYAVLPATTRTPPSTYTWSDFNLAPGTYYEYHFEAVNVSGNNGWVKVSATTLTLPPVLSATPGSSVVNLSWSAPTGAVSYIIYRGTTSGGEGITPLVTGLTTTTYSDTTALSGVTYFYIVVAVNVNVAPLAMDSAASNEVSATPS